jgi:hypothetical protein
MDMDFHSCEAAVVGEFSALCTDCTKGHPSKGRANIVHPPAVMAVRVLFNEAHPMAL